MGSSVPVGFLVLLPFSLFPRIRHFETLLERYIPLLLSGIFPQLESLEVSTLHPKAPDINYDISHVFPSLHSLQLMEDPILKVDWDKVRSLTFNLCSLDYIRGVLSHCSEHLENLPLNLCIIDTVRDSSLVSALMAFSHPHSAKINLPCVTTLTLTSSGD